MNTIESNKKIMILCVPLSGHVNALAGVACELVKREVKVIFYAIDEYRDIVTKSGAEFREYPQMPVQMLSKNSIYEEKEHMSFKIWRHSIEISYEMIPFLIKTIELEKPDMIINDSFAIYGKYVKHILTTYCDKKIFNFKKPLFGTFQNSFVYQKYAYPFIKPTLVNIVSYFNLIFKQIKFSWAFGLNIINPLSFLSEIDCDINLVGIFPELQPKIENFALEKHQFVGSCLNEQIRSINIKNDKLKQILEYFSPVNPHESAEPFYEDTISDPKLVYCSLGSVYCKNLFIFELIISAIRSFNLNFGEEKIQLICQVGKDLYHEFQFKKEFDKYNVPDNVMLLDEAPQIEILKRASLFISHGGINSICEAIHFAVPMICLPLESDQNLNAMRADEIGICKRLDHSTLSVVHLKSCIIEVLYNDKFYLENTIKYSKISRKHNGSFNSANIIVNYINDFRKKSS